MSSYPPTPQRKACDCSDPCISTDDVYYAGPNLPNSGINTYNVLTSVIEKLDAIYAVPTLQRVTETGNLTTLPIIADSFVKIGGDGTNVLLDDGNVLPIGDLPTGVTETSQLINDGEDGINPFITALDIPAFNPSDYDLDEFTNNNVDPFSKISDLPVYSDFIQDSITNGVINKAPTENAVYDALQLKQNNLGYTPVNKAGDTMLGDLILNQDPSTALGAATKQYVDSKRPYKVYTALLTQSGTSAPTAVVLENTIGNIVWSYNNIGVYTALSIGNFTVNKTAVFISSQGFGGGYGLVTSVNNANNGNQITITTQNSIGGVNGNLENTSIEIRVYN